MNPAAELPLRDIHLPAPVPWWPPAPGWWVLASLLALLAVTAFLLYRRYREQAPRRAARRSVEQVFNAYAKQGDARAFLAELSLILRRTALSRFPREEVAGLTGEAWLAFLDRGLEPKATGGGFSSGAGRVLASGPYAPEPSVDADALRALCDAWVRGLAKGKRK